MKVYMPGKYDIQPIYSEIKQYIIVEGTATRRSREGRLFPHREVQRGILQVVYF
jgi:hypothetical protein